MTVVQIILLYILSVNLGGFIAFGIDKKRSVRSKWRIPETTLMAFALMGGSIGCFLGMRIFRHKTQKPLFFIGVPVILLLQVLFAVVLFYMTPLSFMIQ